MITRGLSPTTQLRAVFRVSPGLIASFLARRMRGYVSPALTSGAETRAFQMGIHSQTARASEGCSGSETVSSTHRAVAVLVPGRSSDALGVGYG